MRAAALLLPDVERERLVVGWGHVLPAFWLGAVLLLGEGLTGLLLVAAVLVGAGLWVGRAVPARATPAPAPR